MSFIVYHFLFCTMQIIAYIRNIYMIYIYMYIIYICNTYIYIYLHVIYNTNNTNANTSFSLWIIYVKVILLCLWLLNQNLPQQNTYPCWIWLEWPPSICCWSSKKCFVCTPSNQNFLVIFLLSTKMHLILQTNFDKML